MGSPVKTATVNHPQVTIIDSIDIQSDQADLDITNGEVDLKKDAEEKEERREAETTASDTSEPDTHTPKDTVESDPINAEQDPELHTNGSLNDHNSTKISFSGQTPRRVKVYLLQGEDWLDNGTGYCVGEIDTSSNLPYFVVRNELNSEEVILKSFLEGSIQYQRQQETLIVWTDLTGKDLALSFQESEGCNDLCEFIIRVQQEHISPDISLYYVIPNMLDDINQNGASSTGDINNNSNDITELITGPITYPPEPTKENLETILELCNQNSNSKFTRLSLRNFIIREDYLTKLNNIFKLLEEGDADQNQPQLCLLSEIAKAMILFNETPLLEHILDSDELIWGLIGILEYDSNFPLKASYRDTYRANSFKSIIDVKGNTKIFKKDFHLNFFKDVVMTRFLDDSCFSMISSLIYVNQVEIIELLKDESILKRLFTFYEDFEKTECNEESESESNGALISSAADKGSDLDSHAASITDKTCNSKTNGSSDVSESHNNAAGNGKSHSHSSNGASLVSEETSEDQNIHNAVATEEPFDKLHGMRNGVKMLHQYMLIAKNLQSFQKLEFFANLVKNGLFKMLRFALRDDIGRIRVLGTELIIIIIEQDVSLVNSIDKEDSIDNSDPPLMDDVVKLSEHDDTFVESKNLKLKLSDDMTLISILTNLLLEDKNPGLKMQAFEALRILLDSNIASTSSASATPSANSLGNEEQEHGSDDFNDINTKNYFRAFYSKVAHKLFGTLSLLGTTSDAETIARICSEVKSDTLLYQQLCDLISYCTKEHETLISQAFFLDKSILIGVVKLLRLNVKIILKLSAIRCLKNIVLLNDNIYSRYIIKQNLLDDFFAFFELHKKENNLLNSTCLDFIEVLLKNCDPSVCSRRQNFKLLVSHIYNTYTEFVEKSLNQFSTGSDLIVLVENGFYENMNQHGEVEMSSSEDDGAIIDDSDESGMEDQDEEAGLEGVEAGGLDIEADEILLDEGNGVAERETLLDAASVNGASNVGDTLGKTNDIGDAQTDHIISDQAAELDEIDAQAHELKHKSPTSLFENIDQELIKKRQLETEDQTSPSKGFGKKKSAHGTKNNGSAN